MGDLISVIVPVYNTREYLEKCVFSILNQTYKNLEIILVDDGSTDGSSGLCDELEMTDSRVKVIHKKNGGVVSARLKGLEYAKGEYGILIDSDDWIEPEMISELYKSAVENNADIVTSGFYKEKDAVYEKVVDGIMEGVYSSKYNKVDFFEKLIYCYTTEQLGIIGALWNKLVKRVLLKEVHICISNKIAYAEDAAVVFSCCVRAKTIVVTHKAYYHYTLRMGSAVYKSNDYYYRNINDLYLFLRDEFEKSEFKIVLMKQLDAFMISLVLRGLNHYFGLNHEMTLPYYDFDKTVLEKGARLVLYGSGRVGKSYYKQICADRLYRLVGWVDKEYLYYQKRDLNVLSPDKLKFLEYDYILLAFLYEGLAQTVKADLMSTYGIEENKIIWLKPVNIIDKYNLIDL